MRETVGISRKLSAESGNPRFNDVSFQLKVQSLEYFGLLSPARKLSGAKAFYLARSLNPDAAI
jgi:hypothetical protein